MSLHRRDREKVNITLALVNNIVSWGLEHKSGGVATVAQGMSCHVMSSNEYCVTDVFTF